MLPELILTSNLYIKLKKLQYLFFSRVLTEAAYRPSWVVNEIDTWILTDTKNYFWIRRLFATALYVTGMNSELLVTRPTGMTDITGGQTVGLDRSEQWAFDVCVSKAQNIIWCICIHLKGHEVVCSCLGLLPMKAKGDWVRSSIFSRVFSLLL